MRYGLRAGTCEPQQRLGMQDERHTSFAAVVASILTTNAPTQSIFCFKTVICDGGTLMQAVPQPLLLCEAASAIAAAGGGPKHPAGRQARGGTGAGVCVWPGRGCMCDWAGPGGQRLPTAW